MWLAKTRSYGSSLEMALDQSNVPRAVVDQLVGTVHENADAIKRAGVDLNDPEVISAVMDRYREVLASLKELL